MTMFALTWIGLICWCVCFWWMHRISARQDALLKELHEITTRIEHLSQAEHDLISDVHPKFKRLKRKLKTFLKPFHLKIQRTMMHHLERWRSEDQPPLSNQIRQWKLFPSEIQP